MELKDGLIFLKLWLICFKLSTSQENNVGKGKILYFISDGLITSIQKSIKINGPSQKKGEYLMPTKFMEISGKLLLNNWIVEQIIL